MYATLKISADDVLRAATLGGAAFARLKQAEAQAAILQMLETRFIEMQEGYHIYPQPEAYYDDCLSW